jgi:hypothetical protein
MSGTVALVAAAAERFKPEEVVTEKATNTYSAVSRHLTSLGRSDLIFSDERIFNPPSITAIL